MKRFVACCLALTAALAAAWAGPSAANEVTIKGMVLNNVHTGEEQTSVFVYALDGTPEIRAEVDRIMAQYYPDKGLDGDAARKLQDQFTAKLKYFIDGPHAEELGKKATYGARQPTALTGTVAEKDGKRWITVSKYADTTLHYPAKVLAADKPLVMPDKPPLGPQNQRQAVAEVHLGPARQVLHGRTLLPVPALAGGPAAHGDAHQGLLHGRAPHHPGDVRGGCGQQSQHGESGQGAGQRFLRRYVRVLPDLVADRAGGRSACRLRAEWEYAARVGTSNPAFREKYKDQDSSSVQPMAVKSKPPNAWGFYDMVSSGWERVSDGSGQLDRQDTVDPQHIPPEDQGKADQNRQARPLRQGQWAICRQRNRVHQQRPRPREDLPRHHPVSRGGGRAVME